MANVLRKRRKPHERSEHHIGARLRLYPSCTRHVRSRSPGSIKQRVAGAPNYNPLAERRSPVLCFAFDVRHSRETRDNQAQEHKNYFHGWCQEAISRMRGLDGQTPKFYGDASSTPAEAVPRPPSGLTRGDAVFISAVADVAVDVDLSRRLSGFARRGECFDLDPLSSVVYGAAKAAHSYSLLDTNVPMRLLQKLNNPAQPAADACLPTPWQNVALLGFSSLQMQCLSALRRPSRLRIGAATAFSPRRHLALHCWCQGGDGYILGRSST